MMKIADMSRVLLTPVIRLIELNFLSLYCNMTDNNRKYNLKDRRRNRDVFTASRNADFDVNYNLRVRSKILNSGSFDVDVLSMMRGRFYVKGCVRPLPFPIYLDAKAGELLVHQFVKKHAREPVFDKRSDEHDHALVLALLNSRLRDKTKYAAVEVGFAFFLFILCAFFQKRINVHFIFALFSYVFVAWLDVPFPVLTLLAAPLFEEVIKSSVGYFLFAIIEFAVKLIVLREELTDYQTLVGAFVLSLPAAWFHCWCSYFDHDYRSRVILHFLFNAFCLLPAAGAYFDLWYYGWLDEAYELAAKDMSFAIELASIFGPRSFADHKVRIRIKVWKLFWFVLLAPLRLLDALLEFAAAKWYFIAMLSVLWESESDSLLCVAAIGCYAITPYVCTFEAIVYFYGPLFEEVIKPHVGHFVFGFLEFVVKMRFLMFRQLDWIPFIKFALKASVSLTFHPLIGLIDNFILRVVLHCLFNRFAVFISKYDPGLSPHETLWDIGRRTMQDSPIVFTIVGETSLSLRNTLAYDFDLINSVINKDFLGLALKLVNFEVFHPRRLEMVGCLLGIFKEDGQDVSDAVVEMVSAAFRDDAPFPPPEQCDVVLLDGGLKSIFDHFVPERVKVSPAYKRLLGFMAVVAASRWIGSPACLVDIMEHLPSFANLEPIAMFVDMSMSFWKGLKDVVNTGDWMSFFYHPADIDFEIKGIAILTRTIAVPVEELQEKIRETEALIQSRQFKFNGPSVEKLKFKLIDRVAEMKRLVAASVPRIEPICVFLLGPPGTGKTTVIESIITSVSKMNDSPRRAGDTIFYNIYAKHGAETAADESAEYIVINDVPADYAEFDKKGFTPLDVLIQQIVDKAPLSFNSASIENKKRIFSNVRLLIVTTNERCMKFPTPCQRLKRRMETGFSTSLSVYDERSMEVPHKTFKDYGLIKRNETTKFRIQEIAIADKHLTFVDTNVFLGYGAFFRMFIQRYKDHVAHYEIEKEMFSAQSCCDGCGTSMSYHMVEFQLGDIPVDRFVDEHYVGSNRFTYAFVIDDCSKSLSRSGCLTYRPPPQTVLTSGFAYFACLVALFALVYSSVRFWQDNKRAIVVKHASLFDGLIVNLCPMYYEDVEVAVMRWKCRAYVRYCMFQSFLKEHAAVISGVVLLAPALALYYKYARDKPAGELLGNAITIAKSNVDPATMDVGVITRVESFTPASIRDWGVQGQHYECKLVTRGVGEPDLAALVRHNTKRVTFVYPNHVVMDTTIFVLDSDYLVFNHHYLKAINQTGSFKIRFESREYSFSIDDCRYVTGTESYVCRHSIAYPWKDLKKFFLKDVLTSAFQAVKVSSDDVSSQAIACCSHAKVAEFPRLPVYILPLPSAKGDCSSSLVARLSGGCAIAGLLSYGGQNSQGVIVASGFVAITSGQLLEAIGFFSRPPAPSLSVPLQGDLLAPPEKACLRGFDDERLILLGSTGQSGSKFTTKIRPSLVNSYFAPFLSKPFSGPARLKRVVALPNGEKEYYSAMDNFLGARLSRSDLLQSELDCARGEYLDGLVYGSVKLGPLSLMDAVFGVPEFGIGRLPFKTSCGPIYGREGFANKYDLFSLGDDGTYKLNPIVVHDVKELIQGYSRGEMSYIPMSIQGKDEVRPVEKVEKCDIRLFCVLHAPHNLVARMFLIALVVFLLSQPKTSECFGQMNAGSREWHELHQHLFVESWRLIDMDFKKFDRHHLLMVIRAVATLFEELADRCGYEKAAARIVYYVVLNVAYHLCTYEGDIFLEIGSLPSGHILTLILNSVVNSLLMRCAFQRLTRDVPVSEFRKHVRAATVGDDNLSGVSPSVYDWFNMSTIAPLYLDFGYVVTNGNKSSVIESFVDPAKATFLKRKFVFDERIGTILAPIDTDSIYKAICFDKEDSGSESPVARLLQVAAGCQREFFLHGYEAFVSFQNQLSTVSELTNIPFEKLEYDSLLDEYNSKTFRTFACCIATAGTHRSSMENEWSWTMLLKNKVAFICMVAIGLLFYSCCNDPGRQLVRTDIPLDFSRSDGLKQWLASLNENNTTATVTESGSNATVAASERITASDVTPFTKVPYHTADHFHDYLTHPVQLGSFLWNPTAITNTFSADIFATYIATVNARTPKAKNFMFASGKLVFRAVVQGMATAYGKYVITFDPQVTVSTVGFPTVHFAIPQKPRSIILPHLEIDPSKDAVYEMELDPPTPNGLWSVDGTNYGSYLVQCIVFNQIASGTAAAPQANVTYFAYMKEPEFSGLTLLSGELKNEGVLSGPVDLISKTIGMAAPILGPYATTFSTIGSGVASVLRWFGYSKPNIPDVVLPVLNRTVDNWTQSDSRSSSYKLADSSVNSIGISDLYFPIGNNEDMEISSICARRGLIATFTIPTTAASGAILATYNVSPNNYYVLDFPAVANGAELIPLQHMALNYAWWMGDLEFEFEFLASVFHRATVVIGWDPAGGTPSYSSVFYMLHNHTVQISGNETVKILVPYKSVMPALLVDNPAVTLGQQVSSNGLISVFLVNPVVTNGSTDPVYCNVYLRSSNIRFGQPTLEHFQNLTPVLTSGETRVVFGEPTNTSDFSLRFFGEAADKTTKTLASKLASMITVNGATTGSSGTPLGMSFLVPPECIYPGSLPALGAVNVNWFSYLSLGYLGTRGSTSYSLAPSDLASSENGVSNLMYAAVVSNPNLANFTYSTTQFDYTTAISDSLFGTLGHHTMGYRAVHPTLDVTLPHYFPLYFRPNNCLFNTTNVLPTYSVLMRFIYSFSTLTTSGRTTATVLSALGDDGSFVFYRGVPTCTITAPTPAVQ